MTDVFSQHGVMVNHHFCSGTYAKETRIPEGVTLKQHSHPYDHISILAEGTAIVEAGQDRFEVHGPACMTIKAGIAHSVTAVTPITWFCVHATSDTDPHTVDETILNG